MRGSRFAILHYLINHQNDGISSKEAFELFGVTRLAAVIFDLRKHYDIDTVIIDGETRFGEHCQYARYFYRGVKDGNESTSN